jgi:hypothetical protein
MFCVEKMKGKTLTYWRFMTIFNILENIYIYERERERKRESKKKCLLFVLVCVCKQIFDVIKWAEHRKCLLRECNAHKNTHTKISKTTRQQGGGREGGGGTKRKENV